MTALLEAVRSWQTYVGVVLLFGFLPGFVLRAVLLLYPPDDPRRAELLAELYAMPRVWRPVWVGQQLETALWEGPPSRVRAWRVQRVARRARSEKRRIARRNARRYFRRGPDEPALIGVAHAAGYVAGSVAGAVGNLGDVLADGARVLGEAAGLTFHIARQALTAVTSLWLSRRR